jgi:hypothetical protein
MEAAEEESGVTLRRATIRYFDVTVVTKCYEINEFGSFQNS